MKIQVGIITVSDRAAAGQYEDFGGPLVAEAADGYGWSVIAETVVPDNKEQIQRAIQGRYPGNFESEFEKADFSARLAKVRRSLDDFAPIIRWYSGIQG